MDYVDFHIVDTNPGTYNKNNMFVIFVSWLDTYWVTDHL